MEQALEFTFERRPLAESSGFDLGDVVVRGSLGSVSSADKTPSQSLMIYVGLSDLSSGVRKVAQGQARSYEFVGPDSSFSLWFREHKGNVLIETKKQKVALVSPAVLLTSLWNGVQTFLSTPGNQLSNDDPVFEDLQSALDELRVARASR